MKQKRSMGTHLASKRSGRRIMPHLKACAFAFLVLCATVLAVSVGSQAYAAEDEAADTQNDTVSFTAELDASEVADDAEGTIGVAVDALAGALPEDAELHVAAASDEDGVADELDNAEVTYDGFVALDVYFTDAEGNEIEPTDEVNVQFDLPAGLLPDDAENVSVQHLVEDEDGSVTSVETIADDADATDGTVTTDDDTVTAEFAVSSFSSFTITWEVGYGPNQDIEVYCVDADGDSIGDELSDLSRSSAITMSDIAPTISGYSFNRAVMASSSSTISSGTEFVRLRYDNNRWQYSTSQSGSNWQNISSNRQVFLVYTLNLTTVDTVDSTSEGVHMYMFDYSSPAYSADIGGYGDGSTKQGLATSTVDENGWPTIISRNTSFSSFFGSGTSAYDINSSYAVNNLFLKDRYDEDGTFYYSSFENFATLKNDSDSDFTVYEQLGSPNSTESYYYQRGNFMPYNTLNTNSVINHNLYSETGESLNESDDRYNEDIYGFNESANYYFGMYVWADFYQPQDGKIEDRDGSSEDMIFEFTGDDDMWVYIDGVLVLDLGGIHDAQSGYINFATGAVGYTDTETDEEPSWNYTTIKAMFQKADEVYSVNWDGDTFADGSSHRIQIFYMERGAGASNLKISFNLKTIPDGQLAVSKDVENYYAPQLENITYTMKVETYNEDKKEWEAYANQDYTFYGQDETGTTDENGCFKIKYNQTALFGDIPVGTKVRVSEVDSSDTEQGSIISENYDIGYTVTDSSGNSTGSKGEDGLIEAEMPGYGSIHVTVTNTATYTRPLKLVKAFEGTDDSAAPEEFEATFTLYEVDDNGEHQEIGSIKYSDLEDGEYTFWLDVDKTYCIKESFGDGDNNGGTTDLPYKSNTVSDTYGDKSDGQVELTKSSAISGSDVETVTITNIYGKVTANLRILKVDSTDENTKLAGVEFNLYKDDGENSNGSYGNDDTVVTDSPATTGSDGIASFSDLEPGKYWLKEESAASGYQLDDTVWMITVGDDGKITISFPDENGEYGNPQDLSSGTESDGTVYYQVTIKNTKVTSLPQTGSSGKVTLMAAGVACVAIAGYYLVSKRKANKFNR